MPTENLRQPATQMMSSSQHATQRRRLHGFLLAAGVLAGWPAAAVPIAANADRGDRAAIGAGFAVRETPGQLAITCDGQDLAVYVFDDPRILRPFFANVHAPDGTQVTRSHPPIAGRDSTDHESMHPGIWLGFGDLNGQDFWRNKGRIEQLRFTETPAVRDGHLTFATESRLVASNGQPLGMLLSRIRLTIVPPGYLLIWDAALRATEGDLIFGDQEEMGLGVRMATALTEKNGGRLRSSAGLESARNTWGQQAQWCDYSATREGRRLGVTLLAHPANFRPSWWHTRDYGLMVANPFGRAAMKQGDLSRILVKRDSQLRIRFGIWVYAGGAVDPAAAYGTFNESIPADTVP